MWILIYKKAAIKGRQRFARRSERAAGDAKAENVSTGFDRHEAHVTGAAIARTNTGVTLEPP